MPRRAPRSTRSPASCTFPSAAARHCRSCAASPRRQEEERVLEALRAEVLEANLELVRRGLVIYTFGNASAVSRECGLCVIKPSGVPYDKMKPSDMVIADLDEIGRASCRERV